MTRFARSWP